MHCKMALKYKKNQIQIYCANSNASEDQNTIALNSQGNNLKECSLKAFK
jgi:hypothetical protein